MGRAADRLFTKTLVATVKSLRQHVATYSDLPPYVWKFQQAAEWRIRLLNSILGVMWFGWCFWF